MTVDMLKKLKTGMLSGILFLLIAVSGVTVYAQENAAASKAGSYYTVIFHESSGYVNTAYRQIKLKVKPNGTVRLPEVPVKKGYKNVGWSQKKNASGADKKPGEKIRVTKNLNYYAVQKRATAIVFHRNDGSIMRTDYVLSYRKLPTMKNRAGRLGYTFMGWSTKPHQQVNPEYQAGDIVCPKGTMHLYAVEYQRSGEQDISPGRLPKLDTSKYSKVIFVGDSRTLRMGFTMNRECESSLLKNTAFVARGGQGLAWFKKDGLKWLNQEVKSAHATAKKPVAVIFNLGVNDLYRSSGKAYNLPAVIREYTSYMNRLGKNLEEKNCRLFYMSVNPYNTVMLPNPASRAPEDVRTLNDGLRSGLSSSFRYINTYDDLMMRKGYSTDSGRYGVNTEIDDGLHYSTQTYKRIYSYCINKVNKAK